MCKKSLFIDNDLPYPLNKNEIDILLQDIANGSSDAKEKLIICNIRLVLFEVNKRFSTVDYDKQELISIGLIGLIKSVNNYDISKGYDFSTYAIKCIDNEILMFLRRLKKYQIEVSYESPITNDESYINILYKDILTSDYDLVEEVINKYDNIEIYNIIDNLVNSLPNRDKEIIINYFGFYNTKRLTQKELSDLYNVSQAYISRIIYKSINIIGFKLSKMGYIELHHNNKRRYLSRKN